MIKKLNNYFFGEDAAVSDMLWFYGASIGILIVAVFTTVVRFFG